MKKRYEWRELTEDGLLREPKDAGPHYDRSRVNTYGGFDSEEQAFAAYVAFKKAHKFGIASELVLVAFYAAPDVDA